MNAILIYFHSKIFICKIFVGKREEKRPLRRPRCREEDNIRMDLKKVGRCELVSTGIGRVDS
jgi:hypothetical protein